MNSKLFSLLLLLLSVYTAPAQLTVLTGAEIFVIGDIPLSLHNTDLINNGIFSFGVNRTSFTGDLSSSISGSGNLRFFQLEVNKTGNNSVVLQKQINIVNSILFTSGNLNLNGFNADLETTGRLDGERENSRITGANGGHVLFSTLLNAPANTNPGNLGAFFTSSQNLGSVIIKRGHQSQSGAGLVNSILRYYDIVPSNNINLDQLQINYFDGELNGLDENSLVFFKSDNLVDWSAQGFDSRNITGNFVSKNNIASFSRWTLSNLNNPLPVRFILFNAKCEDNKILLTWKTAQEQNSNRFDIERTSDGIQWMVIGSVPAAGNSNTERTYSFTDNNPLPNSQYRIAEHSFDGRVQYTSILRSSCNSVDVFRLWPNPTHDKVFINIVSSNESPVIINVFDSKGALVKMQSATLLQGSNQLSVDIRSLANGVYSVSADWNNGQMKKAVQVVKQ